MLAQVLLDELINACSHGLKFGHIHGLVQRGDRNFLCLHRSPRAEIGTFLDPAPYQRDFLGAQRLAIVGRGHEVIVAGFERNGFYQRALGGLVRQDEIVGLAFLANRFEIIQTDAAFWLLQFAAVAFKAGTLQNR